MQGANTSGSPASCCALSAQFNRSRPPPPPSPTQRAASEQLGISEGDLDQRLQEVITLLPDLASRLPSAPVNMVVKLAGSTHVIMARLLRIKAAFPRVRRCCRRCTADCGSALWASIGGPLRLTFACGKLLTPQLTNAHAQADAGQMVSNRLGLVLEDDASLPDFEAAAAALKQLVPGIDTDRFAEAFPAVLDVDDFERALEVGEIRYFCRPLRGPPRCCQANHARLGLQPDPPAHTTATQLLSHPSQDATRIMPGMDVAAMLRANPDMVMSLMKGKHLITYDQIANPFT